MRRITITACALFLLLLIAAELTLRRVGPILKDRVVETLGTRFNSGVELDALNVSVLRGLAVSG